MSEVPLYPDECGHRRERGRCWECLTLEIVALRSALRESREHVADLRRVLSTCRDRLALVYVARTSMGEAEVGWTDVLGALDDASQALARRP